MSTKSQTDDRDTFERLCLSLDDDLLTEAYSSEEIDQELRDLGIDPEALGQRGQSLVNGLFDKQRLSWQDVARRKHERSQQIENEIQMEFDFPKDLLIQMLNNTQHPQASNKVSAYFRKRKPEDASEEELRELLREIEFLKRIDEDTDGNS